MNLDCIGRGNLREVQMAGMVQKIKKLGLLYQEPPPCEGRGIVIAGGGKYLSWAWANCRHIRNLGSTLPIQVWHLGAHEIPPWSRPMFKEMDVELIDAEQVRRSHPIRTLDGWTIKAFAVMNSPWRNVMFCDADSFLQVIPEEIFNHKEVAKVGSIFFSDVKNCHPTSWAYTYFGLRRQPKEMETGQFVIDKVKCWMALRWWFWISEHRKEWDKTLMGDKGWAEMGLRVTGNPFIWSQEADWSGWGISQKYLGKEWWQHVMGAKRGEHQMPPYIAKLFDEWEESSNSRKQSLVPVA